MLAHAEQAQQGVGGESQQHDKRPGAHGQQLHRPRRQPGNQLRVDLAQALGRQFADYDGHIGHRHHHHRRGGQMGTGLGQAQRQQPARQRLGQDRFTDNTIEQANRSDANLNGGQKFSRVFTQFQRHGGGAVAIGGQFHQPRLARGNQGNL